MNNVIDPVIKRRNKFYGLLIVSAIFLPMLLAYFIYKTGIGFPSGTTNKGVLLQPPQAVQDLVLTQTDSLAILYQSEHKRWRMLVPVTQDCDERCQAYLYLTRQVHIRLAEKAYRVERILLLLDNYPENHIETLKEEHPGTQIFRSTTRELERWLEKTPLPLSPEQYFYLVDQEGFAMMYYHTEHTGQDLLDDIKKLLKFTYDK